MLKSELYQLEKLIGELVNYNETADIENRLNEAGNKAAQVAAICDDLRLKWVREFFSTVKETVLLRYVQFHQAGIISLSDRVLAVTAVNEARQHHYGFYRETIRHLEGLLKFLEKGFYKYFDPNHAVSVDRCHKDCSKIAALLAETAGHLMSIGIEESLIAALDTAISAEMDNVYQAGISYRQVAYIKGMLNLIRERAKQNHFGTNELTQLLFRQNFNSYYFEQWYQNLLTDIIAKAPKKDREELIRSEAALLQSRFVERDKCFDQEQPPINDSLLDWLDRQYAGRLKPADKATAGINGHNRMPLNFSVHQFALFIRLCYLEGCFRINNISNIQRFFIHHFETKKQLNISLKSFGRAFYKADQATAAVVRDFLQRMINLINKTYFP